MTKPREWKDVVVGGGGGGGNSMSVYLTHWYLDIHYIIANSSISQTRYAVPVSHTHSIAHKTGLGQTESDH